ncbi:hypothetical protein RDABS01_040047 [Bienertia sinuspersici]
MDLLAEIHCLFNYFILPSATLARLVNIYMFRCNNKILFVTSRMTSLIFIKKLKETPNIKESREQTAVEIEKTSETEETKQQEEGFIEENPSPSLFLEEKKVAEKIDETEKIRMNGKDKTEDDFHLYLLEASYKNSSTSFSGNRYNLETKKIIQMMKMRIIKNN